MTTQWQDAGTLGTYGTAFQAYQRAQAKTTPAMLNFGGLPPPQYRNHITTEAPLERAAPARGSRGIAESGRKKHSNHLNEHHPAATTVTRASCGDACHPPPLLPLQTKNAEKVY